MSYTAQYWVSVAVTVTLAIFAAIQVGNPDALGISPRVIAWLGIASSGLGVLAGFLPRVTAPPSDDRKGLD